MNILLTGFEPFGGEAINPSWEVARALHGRPLSGATVTAKIRSVKTFPRVTTFRKSVRTSG